MRSKPACHCSWVDLDQNQSQGVAFLSYMKDSTSRLHYPDRSNHEEVVLLVLMFYDIPPHTHGQFHYEGTPFFISKIFYLDYIRLKLFNRLKRVGKNNKDTF